MRHILTRVILASVLAIPVLGRALDVPDGKAAVVEAVLGKVQLTVDSKSSTPKVGQALDFGARLNTGNNGRVSLRHADRAVTRLAPNTELTLKAPGKNKGIFLNLTQGVIRFLVGKRAPGESFEVQTNNAVAAVKGTDAEVSTDGKTTDGTVYASDHEKALSLLDTVSGESILLSPGETALLTSAGFQRHELNKDDFKKSSDRYRGLPKPEVEGASGGEGTGGDEGDKGDDEARKEATVDVAEAVSEAFNDVMEDLGTDSFLERDDRTGDIVAGRIAYDRNGTRTQISSYVKKTADNTLLKATYSKRETGPFKGTSFAEEETVWNKALPENWTGVVKTPLDDPSNLDGNGYPIFFKNKQYFVAGNPQGDLMEVIRNYEIPTFDVQYTYDGVYHYTAGLLNSEQGYSQGLYITSGGIRNPVYYFDYLTDHAFYEAVKADPSSYPNDSVETTLPIGAYPYSNDTWYVNMDYIYGEGESTLGLTYTYDDGSCCGPQSTFLTAEVRILDSNGTPQDVYNHIDPYNTYLPKDFRGVDNAYNIELTYTSYYLSAPIDLLVIPQIFDLMDFFDLPSSSGSGGY